MTSLATVCCGVCERSEFDLCGGLSEIEIERVKLLQKGKQIIYYMSRQQILNFEVQDYNFGHNPSDRSSQYSKFNSH